MSIMRSNIARQLYNTGGITNLINTYQNNPTLQSQMTQQEYLDLFGSQPTSTNTTEQIIQSSTLFECNNRVSNDSKRILRRTPCFG